MKPIVSVILPIYNAEASLEACLESLLQQSFLNWEALLVDNNSVDSSRKIIDSFVNKDSRFILLEEKKQGVVHASQTGFDRAKGKYIARMDADDICFNNRFLLQVEALDRYSEIDLIASQVCFESTLEKSEGFFQYVNWSNSILSAEEISVNRFVESPIVNPTIMCRRKLIENFGFYREGPFPEDYEFFLRLLDHGVKMQKLSIPLLYWKDSKERLTRNDRRYSEDSFYKIKTKYLAQWLLRRNFDKKPLAIWGIGKKSKRRYELLRQEGFEAEAFIDVLPHGAKALNGKKYFHFEDIKGPIDYFILSYVSNRGAREKIRAFLVELGFIEGNDFLLVA